MVIRVPTFERREQGQLIDRRGITQNVSAAALGAGIGEGISAVGGAIAKINRTLTARTDQAVLNKFKNDLFAESDQSLIGSDTEEGYLKKKGFSAMEGLKPTIDGYSEKSKELADGITNRRLKDRVEAERRKAVLGFNRRANTHGVGQTAAYEETQQADLLKNLTQQMVIGRGDPRLIIQSASDVHEAATAWGKSKGQSDEEIDKTIKATLNAGYSQVVQALVNDRDYRRAKTFLNTFDSAIDPDSVAKMNSVVDHGIRNLDTTDYVQDTMIEVGDDFTHTREVVEQEKLLKEFTNDPDALEMGRHKLQRQFANKRTTQKLLDREELVAFVDRTSRAGGRIGAIESAEDLNPRIREQGRDLALKLPAITDQLNDLDDNTVNADEMKIMRAISLGLEGFDDPAKVAAEASHLPPPSIKRLMQAATDSESGRSLRTIETNMRSAISRHTGFEDVSDDQMARFLGPVKTRLGSQEPKEEVIDKIVQGLMAEGQTVPLFGATTENASIFASALNFTTAGLSTFGEEFEGTALELLETGQNLSTFLPTVPDDLEDEVLEDMRSKGKPIFDPDNPAPGAIDPRQHYAEEFLGLPRRGETSRLQDRRRTGALGVTGSLNEITSIRDREEKRLVERRAVNSVIDDFDSYTFGELAGEEAMRQDLDIQASNGQEPAWLERVLRDTATYGNYFLKKETSPDKKSFILATGEVWLTAAKRTN